MVIDRVFFIGSDYFFNRSGYFRVSDFLSGQNFIVGVWIERLRSIEDVLYEDSRMLMITRFDSGDQFVIFRRVRDVSKFFGYVYVSEDNSFDNIVRSKFRLEIDLVFLSLEGK